MDEGMGRSLWNVGLCCSAREPNFLRPTLQEWLRLCEIPADPALKIPSPPIFHAFLTLWERLCSYHPLPELLLQLQTPQLPNSCRAPGAGALNPSLPAQAAAGTSQAARAAAVMALANSNPLFQSFVSLTGDLISAELVCDLMRRTSKLPFPHLIHSSGLITAMGGGFFFFISS